MLNSWEDLEKLNEDEWPDLKALKNNNKNTKQKKILNNSNNLNNLNNDISFLSQSGLRLAHPYYDSQPSVKILSRNSKKEGNNSSVIENQLSKNILNNQKSLEEREKEYAEARKRILGDEEDTNIIK